MPASFDISVLTTNRKTSVAVAHLKPIHPDLQVYVNQEWPLPPEKDWHPHFYKLEPKQEVCYRIFRGHQEMLQLGTKDIVLGLEDDAVPGEGWEAKVECLLHLLDQYEIVSLYSKANWNVEHRFQSCGLDFILPGRHPSYGVAYINGAVAYLVKRETARRIAAAAYEGMPYDIFFCQPEKFKFCAVSEHNPIFTHSFQYGSHRDGNNSVETIP